MSFMDVLRKWVNDVLVGLLTSKKANVLGGAGVSLPMVFQWLHNHGVADNYALGIATVLGMIVGLWLHAQGRADAGKEASAINLKSNLITTLISNGMLPENDEEFNNLLKSFGVMAGKVIRAEKFAGESKSVNKMVPEKSTGDEPKITASDPQAPKA